MQGMSRMEFFIPHRHAAEVSADLGIVDKTPGISIAMLLKHPVHAYGIDSCNRIGCFNAFFQRRCFQPDQQLPGKSLSLVGCPGGKIRHFTGLAGRIDFRRGSGDD